MYAKWIIEGTMRDTPLPTTFVGTAPFAYDQEGLVYQQFCASVMDANNTLLPYLRTIEMTGNEDNQPSLTPSAESVLAEQEAIMAQNEKYLLKYDEVDSASVKCTGTCNRVTKHVQARLAPRPNPTNFPPEASDPMHLMEITKRLLMCSQCAKISLKK